MALTLKDEIDSVISSLDGLYKAFSITRNEKLASDLYALVKKLEKIKTHADDKILTHTEGYFSKS